MGVYSMLIQYRSSVEITIYVHVNFVAHPCSSVVGRISDEPAIRVIDPPAVR
jgi:hypothetical protein